MPTWIIGCNWAINTAGFMQGLVKVAGDPGSYVRKETQYAWECIQKECQKVLATLLQGQAGSATSTAPSDRLGVCMVTCLPFLC